MYREKNPQRHQESRVGAQNAGGWLGSVGILVFVLFSSNLERLWYPLTGLSSLQKDDISIYEHRKNIEYRLHCMIVLYNPKNTNIDLIVMKIN